MEIALAQFNASDRKDANLNRMADLAAEARARGADLVLFPEVAMAHLDAGLSLGGVAEPLDGPFVWTLASFARRHGMAIVAGMYESIAGTDRVHNTVVVLSATGQIIGAYRKIHLYDAFGYRESDRIEPGTGETCLFSVGDVVFGVQTCYDVRFPEITRHLVSRGAEVILLPAAWVHGLLKETQWEVLVRARAIENTVYVAAVDQVNGLYSGSSMLVDPMGVAVARLGEAEGVAVGTVDPDRLAEVRAKLPSLKHARADVYGEWLPVLQG